MRLVAIGDCQTGHKIRQDVENQYPGYYWSSIVGDVLQDVVVFSRGGELTGFHGWWNKWKEYVLDLKPDAVVVCGGIYHFFSNIDPNPEIRKVITNMSESAKSNGIRLALCNMQPFKGSGYWSEQRQVWHDEFNSWLANFCFLSGDIFLDIFNLLEETGTLEAQERFRIDTKFHLSLEGQKELGKFVAKRLLEEKMYG